MITSFFREQQVAGVVQSLKLEEHSEYDDVTNVQLLEDSFDFEDFELHSLIRVRFVCEKTLI